MSKEARKILSGLSTASLIMAGSLPLTAADAKVQKPVDSKTKTTQKTTKSEKKGITDKAGAKSCGADGKSCTGKKKAAGSGQKR